jgi:hypothetical protein
MHMSERGLAVAVTVLLGAFGLAAPAELQAQPGSTVRCESSGGKFHRCALPWRDAQLTRQESKGSCIRGQSWGVDREGLWVDHGCRALFAEAGHDYRDNRSREHASDRDHERGRDDPRGQWHPGRDWDRQIRLDCHSNHNRYQLCQVDVGRHGDVRLVRQVSDARCTEGYSWGWNRAGVWTHHGCRGQFVVDRRW